MKVSTTIPACHAGAKKEIIIYKNSKPSEQEACESIRHFCREHGRKYKKLCRKHSLGYQIDDTIYNVFICTDDPNSPSGGWMIRCIHA